MIILTCVSGKSMAINPKHIVMIMPEEDSTGTELYFVGDGMPSYAKESFHTVLEKLKEAIDNEG